MNHWYSCLLLISHIALGQSVLTGKVIDTTKRQAISNINVTLHLPNSASIMSFAITDKQGRYSIVYQSTADTLQLKVYGIMLRSEKIS